MRYVCQLAKRTCPPCNSPHTKQTTCAREHRQQGILHRLGDGPPRLDAMRDGEQNQIERPNLDGQRGPSRTLRTHPNGAPIFEAYAHVESSASTRKVPGKAEEPLHAWTVGEP